MRRFVDWSGPFVAVLALAATVLFLVRERSTKELTVAELLDSCSPFESLDETRTLDFRIEDHSVEHTEAVGDERTRGALAAEHPKVTRSTWSADEPTKNVVVELGGAKTTYILVTPPGGIGCILAAGAITSADLSSSWFGEMNLSDDQ